MPSRAAFGISTRVQIHGSRFGIDLFVIRIMNYKTTQVLPRSHGVATRTVSQTGKVQINGGPLLKKTQAYPVPFGHALAALYKCHEVRIKDEARVLQETTLCHAPRVFRTKLDLIAPPTSGDRWMDAELFSVFELLQSMVVDRSLRPQ